MEQTPAAQDREDGRKELASGLRRLLADPKAWPLPLAGDYHAFHAFFGGRLVVDIDPQEVTHQFPPQREINGQAVKAADFVLGRGPWQPLVEPLDRSVIHREVADVLAHGAAIRETASYKALVDRLQSGNPGVRNLQGLDSMERIDCYFDDLAKLIASIRDRGYRRRPAYDGLASAEDAAKASSAVRPVFAELTESEIGMAVDADGRFVRVGPGNHRMAIARQLGLPRVPVEFRLFHVAWVRRLAAQGLGPLQAITTGVRHIGLAENQISSGDET